MQLVCVFASDPGTRSALAAALEKHVHVEVCPTRRRLLAMLRRMGATAVLTELRDVHGQSAVPFIATLRARFPAVLLVGVARLRGGDKREIVAAARAGMSDLVLLDFENPWSVIRPLVTQAPVESAISAAVAGLASHVPASVWQIVEHCVRHAPVRLTPDRLARACGLPRRTLSRRLSSVGLPPPAALLAWTRLALAASLLEFTTMPVEHVAELSGFPSAVTLRQCFRRYARLTPSALRGRGGLSIVLAAFRDARGSRSASVGVVRVA